MSEGDELYELITKLDEWILGAGQESAAGDASPIEAPGARGGARVRRLAELPLAFEDIGGSARSLPTAVAAAARRVFEADAAALFIKNHQGGLDLGRALPEHADPAALRRAAERAILEGRALAEPAEDERRILAAPLLRARAIDPEDDRRRIVRPREDDRLGALAVLAHPSEDALLALQLLAAHAATALLRDEHLRFAITDPLTNTFSRPQLGRALSRLARSFDAGRVPFALLLVDLDRFRALNDELGHGQGDRLLAAAAEALTAMLREDDRTIRYGGAAFAIVLPHTDEAGARVVAEKVRAGLAQQELPPDGRGITASVGLAACPAHATEPRDLLKKADQALFQAKRHGRNTWAAWAPSIEPGAPRHDPLAGILTGDFAIDYQQVRILLETFSELSAAAGLDALLRIAIDRVIAATDAQRGALMLVDDSGELRLRVFRDRRGLDLDLEAPLSRSIPERVLRTGEAACHTVGPDPRRGFHDSLVRLEIKTVMCAPLRGGEEPLGILYADGKVDRSELREDMLPFFCALANYIALAVENARLRERLGPRGESS